MGKTSVVMAIFLVALVANPVLAMTKVEEEALVTEFGSLFSEHNMIIDKLNELGGEREQSKIAERPFLEADKVWREKSEILKKNLAKLEWGDEQQKEWDVRYAKGCAGKTFELPMDEFEHNACNQWVTYINRTNKEHYENWVKYEKDMKAHEEQARTLSEGYSLWTENSKRLKKETKVQLQNMKGWLINYNKLCDNKTFQSMVEEKHEENCKKIIDVENLPLNNLGSSIRQAVQCLDQIANKQ